MDYALLGISMIIFPLAVLGVATLLVRHDAAGAADGEDQAGEASEDALVAWRAAHHAILFNPKHPLYKSTTKEYVRRFEQHHNLKPTEWGLS